MAPWTLAEGHPSLPLRVFLTSRALHHETELVALEGPHGVPAAHEIAERVQAGILPQGLSES